MSSSIMANPKCVHFNHLFSHPLCESQPLLKKIAHLAFHILTLGIPLAVYRLISCCFSRRTSSEEGEKIQAIGINAVQQNKRMKPYSSIGQEAIEFARKKLEEHPEILPFQFAAPWLNANNTHQPINEEIARLTNLYWEISFKNFEEVMKQNKDNPWSHQAVIEAADECLKIAYTISNLTLEDLKAFTESLASQGENRSFAQALTKQDSYQYRTYYYCTNVYHYLRGQIEWSQHPWNKEEEGLFFTKEDISENHASLFYKKGTIQNSWKKLYNEYCGRVRLYVNEKELKLADSRHINWTEKDTGVKSFFAIPDTLPT